MKGLESPIIDVFQLTLDVSRVPLYVPEILPRVLLNHVLIYGTEFFPRLLRPLLASDASICAIPYNKLPMEVLGQVLDS